MAVKISDLLEATEFIITDIFHLRTAGGIDKRITGANLRSDLGMIAPFASKVNAGWLWCDGATIDKTANPEYEPLVDYLKAEAGADAAHPYYAVAANEAVLPDLRGAGVRGVDAAANRDYEGVRKSGDYQEDKVLNHLHTTDIGAHGHDGKFEAEPGETHGANTYFSGMTSGPAQDSNITKPVEDTNIGNKTSGNPTVNGVAENVMKNLALYYLIRY